MPLTEALLALASLAGRTLVSAATTEAWASARKGFARLLGRDDPERSRRAEARLEETRAQLDGAPVPELERTRAELEAAWQTRLADLLDEYPDAAGQLQALVDQIQAQLPPGDVSAAGHGLAAGRDVNITASGGGVAAGVIHGLVAPGNPQRPGPAEVTPHPG
jgi:hypothetical protein